MIAKRVVVDDEAAGARYKREFAYCEACASFHGSYPVNSDLELHHIFGGGNRTDETWNFICLCRRHHALATTHNLEHGADSWVYNLSFLGLKRLKGELTRDDVLRMSLRLGPFDSSDELWKAIVAESDVIAVSRTYRRVKALGWVP